MKRSLTWVITAISLVTLALSSLAVSRASAAEWQGCDSGRFCVYSDADGQGATQSFGPEAPVQLYSADWDDKVTSVHNNSPYWSCVYRHGYYGGTLQALRPGYRGNLADTSTNLNDQITSHKLAKSKAGCFTGFERCETGYLCLFTEPGGRGAMTATQSDVSRYEVTWDDRVLSVANYTDKHACFYADPDFTGSWSDGGKSYGKYVVLRTDSTVIPQPYAGGITSHKLVVGTSQC
ncbi:peptidase inhibitor family I36 protein [Streptomyces sp. NPDC048349]|uniref:peptidase inhibitor family I36 protein n=1 Tax=Streptomyces sp. NPDC048349 TaxID=3155486 RepID=UPI00341313CB